MTLKNEYILDVFLLQRLEGNTSEYNYIPDGNHERIVLPLSKLDAPDAQFHDRIINFNEEALIR